MRRRALCGLIVALPLFSQLAHGGTYLSQASALLKGAEVEVNALRKRSFDQQMARTLLPIAEARRDAAKAMVVPKEVMRTHPHLLLCLESYERAIFSVSEKKHKSFLLNLERARRERSTFISLLKTDGWQMPA